MLTVKNRHFVKDGKELILFGGEIHYFRLPREAWEDRILKAKAAGMNTVSTLVPWMYHEPLEGQADLAGKREPETDLGAFLALIRKHGMYCILKPGPYIMSEMRNHGLPDWFFEKYPQCLGKTRQGESVEDHYVFLENEIFLRKVEGWYRAVGQAAAPYMEEKGGPIVMVQLDNEIGMLNWCSGMPEFCPENIEAFRTYLKEGAKGAPGYWDMEPQAFYRYVQTPPAEKSLEVNRDLTRYSRLYYSRYFETLQGFCRKYLGKALNIVNVHGFDTYDIVKRGKDYPSALFQLAGAAALPDTVTGGDYYLGNVFYDNFQDICLADAFTGAVQNPDQPLFSDEFQGGFQTDTPRVQPTSYELTTRLALADGMDGICYFLLAGGVNPDGIGAYGYRHDWQAAIRTDGGFNPQYANFRHMGRLLTACGPTLAKTRFRPALTLGILMDNVMTEYLYHDEVLAARRQELEHYSTDFLYNGMGKGLAVAGFSYDGRNLERELRPEETPCLAVCSTPYMDEAVQRRLLRYVQEGGRLFLYPTVPDRDWLGRPCGILKEALGCGTEIHEEGMVRVEHFRDVPVIQYTDFGPREGAFAWDQDRGRVCGFVRTLGQGKVLCYGMGHNHEYYYRDEILLEVLKKLDMAPPYTTDRLEDKLLLSARENVQGGAYLTILNLDEYEKTTGFYRNGQPLFGGRKLRVGSRKGLLLPMNMELTKDLKILWSTAEILGLEETEEKICLTLALHQIQDELLLRFPGEAEPASGYGAERTPEGLRIRSLLDGRIEEELTVVLRKNGKEEA